jgi:hypothetical protein
VVASVNGASFSDLSVYIVSWLIYLSDLMREPWGSTLFSVATLSEMAVCERIAR